MAVLFLLSAILGCVLARPSNEIKPVEMTLYYESLSPGCRVFISDHLLPTYTEGKYHYLISKLTLVPYGLVKINETTHDYICANDPGECDGNRLHGCAIKYIPDEFILLNYISCLNDNTWDWPVITFKYPIHACQDALPEGAYSKIMNCYNSAEGRELFEQNGKITNAFFTISPVAPYTSFNNTQDDWLALDVLHDFKAVLCRITGGC